MTWFVFLFFVIFIHAHQFLCEFRWGQEKAKTNLAGNSSRCRHQKFPVCVFRTEGTGQHKFYYWQQLEMTKYVLCLWRGRLQISQHVLCVHLVPLLVMYVVALFCVKLPNFHRAPEIPQFLSPVTFVPSKQGRYTLSFKHILLLY